MVPWKMYKQMPFIKYYTSYDVVAFTQSFYKNKDGMMDKFIEMWVKVVSYFRDEDNVIGYDTLNEPSGGNLWGNPYAYIGPYMENNKLLLPFYKKLSKEVRNIDKDKLLFFFTRKSYEKDLIKSSFS